MRPVGLVMVGIAIAMFAAARPRDRQVVPWLASDKIEFSYVMAIVILLAVGGAIAVHG